MSEFTKGPWFIWGDWAIKAEGVNSPIATFEHFDQRPEWSFANANLIAAAPDLFDALMEAVEMIERQLDFNDDGDGLMISRCRAVLAKARGEK